MKNNILTVNHLSVSFYDNNNKIWGKRKENQVLKDISFNIKEKEIVGLVGESGCGKSTLAKTILGLNKTYSGEIIHLSKFPQMIFQDPYSSLNPSKNISFILSEPLKMNGSFTKAEIEEKVLQMLNRVGLSNEFANRFPSELSGGQRQRICIGQALMLNPKLLVADEPVSALDVTIQAQVMKLLFSLHKEMGLSILFISHDLRIVYQICDSIIIMKDGKIIESGKVDEIYTNPVHQYTKTLLNSARIYGI